MRSGRLRAFALEGSVNTLRRWTTGPTANVRAELSLVLMNHPSRVIVGSLAGAATARERVTGYDLAAVQRRLEEQALAGAVRGALGGLAASLGTQG